MPSPSEILAGLHEIANDYLWLAIFWHVYFALLIGAVLVRLIVSKRLVACALSLPLLSVSGLAWLSGNPFNGIVFAVAGGALLVISFSIPQSEKVGFAPVWATAVGAFIVLFGLVYPHFLNTSSAWMYLFAAPTGLVPCPTVSIVVGLTIALRGLDSYAWSLTLGITGVFYGVFGAARLGVTIDWVLAVGAAAMLLMVVLYKKNAFVSGSAH